MRRKPPRILVILDDVGPGDALRSKFVLTSIRAAQPDARITLLVSEAAAEVFEPENECDTLIVSRIYRSGLRGRWRNRLHKAREMLRALRAVGLGHDQVLILNWGSSALDVLARLAGRQVIGYDNRAEFVLSRSLGTYDVEGDPVAQNRALLSVAGIRETPLSATAPVESGDPQNPLTRSYAVLHTGSDWACQQWSQDRWARLADRIIDELGLDVVFTGLREEAAYVTAIQGMMRRPSASLAGQTALPELQRLISRAVLCVTVDSSPYELAQLTATPTIVLAGPTSARPQVRRNFQPVVVNCTSPSVGSVIRACQRTHSDGHCHDYTCPLSQLRRIEVDEVMQQVTALRREPVTAPA